MVKTNTRVPEFRRMHACVIHYVIIRWFVMSYLFVFVLNWNENDGGFDQNPETHPGVPSYAISMTSKTAYNDIMHDACMHMTKLRVAFYWF